MIAVDWGTSSLRVHRLDAAGRVVDSRRSAQGVLACAGQFEQVLAQAIAGWDDRLVVMAGMVGSRQGWQEVPYVACPATLADIAGGMRRLHPAALPGRQAWIAPGLSVQLEDGVHDVMRGEETQLCGMLADLASGTHLVCLAGTHSKLARVADGRIARFSTAMTGEVFALLRTHSILGRSMRGHDYHAVAFARGLDQARAAGDLLRHLFAVRTHALFGQLGAEELGSYLSGLLIGHELNDLPGPAGTVHLVAPPSLQEPYATALARRGFGVRQVDDEITARGLHLLAMKKGLLPD